LNNYTVARRSHLGYAEDSIFERVHRGVLGVHADRGKVVVAEALVVPEPLDEGRWFAGHPHVEPDGSPLLHLQVLQAGALHNRVSEIFIFFKIIWVKVTKQEELTY
jgi:hypothetical protein